MASCSVVIPATDHPPTLARCLAALEASCDRPEEVIVVDGPERLSAAGARNEGLRRATGEVVVFVDADVLVAPDAIGRLRRRFEADAGLSAVFGSYDDAPAVRTAVSAFRNLLHHHVHQSSAGPAETFWTGLGAVRRSAVVAVGGFDEARYRHPSIEDIDLGARLVAAGHHIELDPTIQGTHLKRWTVRSMVWTDLARRGIPWVALQLRSGAVSATLNCGWRHRASAVTSAAGVGATVLGQLPLAIAALLVLAALNASFYGLLLRRLGLLGAAAGVGLHVLHHLTAVASVPAGALLWALDARRSEGLTPSLAAVEGSRAS
ncbi:MAG: glycosyltransferase family 2 protein [Actinomycetota bacterium]